MTSPADDETAEILDILGAEEAELEEPMVEIPELNLTVRARGDIAAFWNGYRDGRAGRPRRVNPPYDEPSIYRRAHARGVVSQKELT